MFALIQKFFSNIIPAVVRPLQVLWNQILGAIFLGLALFLARPTWRAWQEFDGQPVKLIRLGLAIFFFILMAGFGLHAFWRARRLDRA